MSRDPSKTADARLIAAEKEILRVMRKLDTLPEGDESFALQLYLDRLDRLIAGRPPRTLAGAAVKLRRLLDPDLGIAIGRGALDVTSLAQVLVLLHRIAGAPRHPTRLTLDRSPLPR
jgi:hypothetical protein